MKHLFYQKIIPLYLLLTMQVTAAFAQYSSDLGMPAYSTLAWDHISSIDNTSTAASLGLTKDGRMYTWGTNIGNTINAGTSAAGRPVVQSAPYFVKSPAGETPVKVKVVLSGGKSGFNGAGGAVPLYFCLTASGKMYAWGINFNLAGNNLATFPVQTTTPAANDTTKAKRSPILMTNIGESTFVDMDFSKLGEYGVVIGASGKAYHIGNNGGVSGGGLSYFPTFAALPNPAGVSGTFKYTRVWLEDFAAGLPMIYLKGNDGNVYYTGAMSAVGSSGVPSIYYRTTPAPTFTTAETLANVRTITPRLVPFPAGEDIVDMNVRSSYIFDSNYAISASGKAYVTGLWRMGNGASSFRSYVAAPLAAAPPADQLDPFFVNSGTIDTAYIVKQFQQIAMPVGVTKILSIIGGGNEGQSTSPNIATLMVGNDNKVYWSGTGNATGTNTTDLTTGNYLVPTTVAAPATLPDECYTVRWGRSNTYYSWQYQSINYQGAAKLFRSRFVSQLGIISASGRGYFDGYMSAGTAPGKVLTFSGGFNYQSAWPIPIANEQLLSCNDSPGTGGPGLVTPTVAATGVIDCSKTQIVAAPVNGTPNQHVLVVTIAVSATGTFSPVSVTGSGMSIANNQTSITATRTGTQQFSIPINYDGSALNNTFAFTVGQAGGCTADLTGSNKKVIKTVYTLDNCTAITPGVISK